MTERAPQVELTDVSRIFDVGESAGIRDVSLAIAAGDFVAIVGPSGAGKSTLLNILGLLDRPDSGTYRLAGVDVGPLDEAERDRIRSRDFGFVFQSSFVLGDQSTLRNAALGLRIQGVRMRRRSALARRALARLGIESRWAVPARLLSGGERQRLALARAVAGDPKVLLADEPTGNLDSDNGRVVIEHLRALNKRGVTVVVVTHDGAVAAAASRRIDIRDGLVSEAHDVAPPHPATVSVVANEPLRRWGGKRPPRRRWATAVLDDLADAFTAISSRTLRSALLALAFTLGVGGLIASTGLSETASAQVSDRLTAAALDEVRITVPGGFDLLRAGDDRLENWITAVRELPHVVDVGFLASVPTSVAHIRRIDPSDPAPPSEVFLVAASAGYLEMMGAQDSAGAPSSLLDHPEVTGSAWVGTRAAELLGLASAGPGSTLWAVGREINAVGTFVAGARAPELERVIVVTPDVLADRAGVGVILVVRTEAGFPAVIAEAAPVALDPSNPGRFRVETVADLRDLRFGVANDLGLFVALISALILLLAVISASTTMYISVQARAPEIALRRAVGSSRGGVARLFLAEGLLVGTAGGAAGALVGTLVTLVIAEASGWTPVLPQGLAPLSIGLGVGTGLLSAAIPAWIASRQEPSAAIRG